MAQRGQISSSTKSVRDQRWICKIGGHSRDAAVGRSAFFFAVQRVQEGIDAVVLTSRVVGLRPILEREHLGAEASGSGPESRVRSKG